MGTCLSKKTSSSSATTTSKPAVVAATPPELIPKPEPDEQKKITYVEAAESVKKEIFVIKQRKSHERQRPEERFSNAKADDSFSSDPATTNIASAQQTGTSSSVPLRTASCTKEEVDAILIQCGRLSRSSSSKGGGGGSGKYSGSKRSYDFDQDDDSAATAADKKSSDEDRRHASRPSHRRTPSKEKDAEYKRSSSRDRCSSSGEEDRRRGGSGGGSRRTSRSPGRRSEAPSAVTISASSSAADKPKPAKMVSVPASVSSNRDNKLINGGSAAAVVPDSAASTVVKRVSVKRNTEAGGFRGAASPRSQSPAYSRPNNNGENAQHLQQPSLSRNSSRKAEHSPYRRSPMSEIDQNCPKSKEPQDPIDTTSKVGVAGLNTKMQRRKEGEERKPLPLHNYDAEQQQQATATDVKGLVPLPTAAAENLVSPQATITRTRSSRRSRDLDLNLSFNPDTLLNPTSYASLLLEDIQNFHQQHNTCAATTAFSLPPCVSKARSILEAVADLNSCINSNPCSVVFSEERSSEAADWSNNKNTKNIAVAAAAASNANLGKKRQAAKDPIMESEVVVNNDINEPSLHKYVTVRRGMMGGEVEQQQESSGSNSFVGGQHWAAAASWETNSVESTWTSRSNTNTGEDSVIVVKESKSKGSENQLAVAHDIVEAAVVDERKNTRINGSRSTQMPSVNPSGKRKESHHLRGVQQGRAGRAIPISAASGSL